ncbi:uncharacterized protein LOC100175875 [Ciona intestinalis]
MSSTRRIAVIGAGAAGLCAARNILSKPHFTPVVYEGTNHVGGTWFFTEQTGKDEYGLPIHSSMYKNLRTNLPKQVMAFPDFPFNKSLPSFIKHTDVLNYLESYCDEYKLRNHIEFSTLVEKVEPLEPENRFTKWEVTTYHVSTKQTSCNVFDGVMVCNGHYSIPRVPDIEGMSDFPGRLIHSHDYRAPQDFENRTVVILGAKSSGTDIALDLAPHATKVVMSHKGSKFQSELPANVEERPVPSRFTQTGVDFVDGTHIECDVFMFCTGYKFTFPFLGNLVSIDNNRITPLYKHLINIKYPTLSLIGACSVICPFPQFHCQVNYAISLMDGSAKLLSEEEMLEDEKQDFKTRIESGLPARHAHLMGHRQWDYNNDLADLCGIQRISDNVRLLYDLCHQRRTFNLMFYKNDEFNLSDAGNFYKVD